MQPLGLAVGFGASSPVRENTTTQKRRRRLGTVFIFSRGVRSVNAHRSLFAIR